jgi:small subunit ribosomal protein S6
MNNYELTFLLQDEAEAKNIKTLIKDLEGKITEEKAWGERALTYPINKLISAKYFTWHIQLSAKNMAELKKKLNFNDNLLRYLLLKQEEK